jgi:hypothetical protein
MLVSWGEAQALMSSIRRRAEGFWHVKHRFLISLAIVCIARNFHSQEHPPKPMIDAPELKFEISVAATGRGRTRRIATIGQTSGDR